MRIIRELYAHEGQVWLNELPQLLSTYAQRWQLSLLPPFPNLTYNYVAPGIRQDGTAVVLKAGVVNPELRHEMAALQQYAGQGAVRLLTADPDNGLCLLARLQPGTSLASLPDDDAATRIAAMVMQQLWRPWPESAVTAGPFPTVSRWAAGLSRLRAEFKGGVGPFPRRLVETAESLFPDLLSSSAPPVLLHGDLHHDNILLAGDQWLAIDPKGVIGEPAYEVGALLRNFWGRDTSPAQRRHLLARRVAILCEMLGFDRQRIIGWGVAQAVLSAWWNYEDLGGDWQPSLAVAEALIRG